MISVSESEPINPDNTCADIPVADVAENGVNYLPGSGFGSIILYINSRICIILITFPAVLARDFSGLKI